MQINDFSIVNLVNMYHSDFLVTSIRNCFDFMTPKCFFLRRINLNLS